MAKAKKPEWMEDDDDDRLSQFSLFEGDLMNRAFAKIGLGPRHPIHMFWRCMILISISYGVMALLSIPDALAYKPGQPMALNFFYDFAAYTQYFIGLPLFIIAERVISANILAAARDFEESGIIADKDKPELERIEKDIEMLRKKMWPEVMIMCLALYMGVMALGPEMFTKDPNMVTWHSYKIDHEFLTHWMTPAGWYAMLIGLPIMSYIWLRCVWKICMWYWYLRRVSRFKLIFVASHPDRTGGIAFLSEVQAKFAIVILAFGISNVVSTVGYKIAIENAPVNLPPVWGMVVGFVIMAPVLFLSPLLLFTKQLSRVKKRAMAQFREKAMRSAIKVEDAWLHSEDNLARDEELKNELAQLNLLTGFYDRIHGMRVVPFDLRSAGQLIGSAVGPVIPILPYFIEIDDKWAKVLEVFTKWLPG